MSAPTVSPEAAASASRLVRNANAGELASEHYVARFLDHYQQLTQPLLDQALCGLPLYRVLPKKDQCWQPEGVEARRNPGHLSVPWVGREYKQHRIVLLADNLRNDGHLDDELGVVVSVQEALKRGERVVHEHMNSTFGYGCALYGDAVLRHDGSDQILADPQGPADPCGRARLRENCASSDGQVLAPPSGTPRSAEPDYGAQLSGGLSKAGVGDPETEGDSRDGRKSSGPAWHIRRERCRPRSCIEWAAPWGESALVAATYHPSRAAHARLQDTRQRPERHAHELKRVFAE